MKAEEILQKNANNFKITHPTLYKTIINSINEAINYTPCCTELCECAVDCVETEYNKDFVLVCKKCQKPLIA